MSGPTPGPWHLSQPWAGFANILDANDNLVVALAMPQTTLGDRDMPAEEKEANARLVAAAPLLLAALKAARRDITELDSQDERQFSIDRIDAAIASAEGRP